MFEAHGDLWTYEPADAICITTNGYVKADGNAVMGRGCAREAKSRYPWLLPTLGMHIRTSGNHVYQLGETDDGKWLFSFPVKHNWWEHADLDLIEQSAEELMEHIKHCGLENVLLPRPGCGNGKLTWERVKPILEPIIDGRVTVITY